MDRKETDSCFDGYEVHGRRKHKGILKRKACADLLRLPHDSKHPSTALLPRRLWKAWPGKCSYMHVMTCEGRVAAVEVANEQVAKQ